MRFITLTEFDSDNLIHLNVGRVVAVRYADPATQILCAEGGFFVKAPPEQVLKAPGSRRRSRRKAAATSAR